MNKRALLVAAALVAAFITAVLPISPVFSKEASPTALDAQIKKVLQNQDKIMEALEEIKKELQIVKVRASLN